MNKLFILATILTAAAMLVSAGFEKDQQDEQEISRLNAQEVAGLLRNDVPTLQRIWADDFVVTNPLNQFANKQQVVQLIKSGTLAFAAYDRQVEYQRIYGDAAVVVGSESVVWSGKMPNAGKISHLRFTAIWMRRDGRWQEVVRHANIIH